MERLNKINCIAFIAHIVILFALMCFFLFVTLRISTFIPALETSEAGAPAEVEIPAVAYVVMGWLVLLLLFFFSKRTRAVVMPLAMWSFLFAKLAIGWTATIAAMRSSEISSYAANLKVASVVLLILLVVAGFALASSVWSILKIRQELIAAQQRLAEQKKTDDNVPG